MTRCIRVFIPYAPANAAKERYLKPGARRLSEWHPKRWASWADLSSGPLRHC